MKSIKEVKSLSGKRILLRLDLNVPIVNGKIADTTRVDKILPTLKFLIKENSKVIILSHIGRPKGKIVKELSLKPICEDLENKLDQKVKFHIINFNYLTLTIIIYILFYLCALFFLIYTWTSSRNNITNVSKNKVSA